MNKTTAFALLGIDVSKRGHYNVMAKTLGCTRQAIAAWPEDGPLPRATADRVLASAVRRRAALKLAAGEVLDPIEEDAVMPYVPTLAVEGEAAPATLVHTSPV